MILGTLTSTTTQSARNVRTGVGNTLGRGRDAGRDAWHRATRRGEGADREAPPDQRSIERKVEPAFDPAEYEAIFAREEPRGLLNPFRLFGTPTVLAIGALLLAALVTVVARQLLGILADIAVLNEPYQMLAYGAVWLVALIAILATGRLVLTLVRLRRSPAISRRTVRELERRGAIRAAMNTDARGAGAWVVSKLSESIPANSAAKAHDKSLRKLGWNDEQIETFRIARERLVDTHTDAEPRAWLTTYRTEYTEPLDACARRLIRRRAVMVAAKTAVLPHGLLDTAVVLTHSVLLIGDLARLYHLSTDRTGVIALSWRVIVGTLIAGQLDELAESAGTHLGQAVAEASSGVAVRAGAAFAGQVVGKAGEGAVNALLIHRLGRHAMRRFSPMA